MSKTDESQAFRALLSTRLRQFRERHKLTRKALADLLPGVSAQMLLNAEEERSVPAGLALIRVVRIADFTPEELAQYPLSAKNLIRASRKIASGDDQGAILDIGPLLLARRIFAGLSVPEMATFLNLAVTTYRRLEAGVPPERLALRQQIANFLGLPLGAVATLRAVGRNNAPH